MTGAVAYLKQNFGAKYPLQMNVFVPIKNATKGILLAQLIQFVEKTLPVLCLKCETAYTPMTQDGSAQDDVSCIKCKIPAHRVCYKPETININQGLVYLCQSCLVNMGKVEETKEGEKAEEKLSDSSGDEENDEDEEKTTNKENFFKRKHVVRSPDSEFEKVSGRKHNKKRKSRNKSN